MGSITWDEDIARVYDAVYAASSDDAVLRPMVDLLSELAGLQLRDRWEDREHSPFTSQSASQVVVYEKTP